MKIEELEISLADLFDGWQESEDEGVVAYHGLLDVRPPYQREFVYNKEQRDKVIKTVFCHFPLNSMYWVKRTDGKYEVLDGQQRTISICRFMNSEFQVEFDGIPYLYCYMRSDMKQLIDSYKLKIYVCEGPPSEKIEWFKTINIAGEKLTQQEINNAIFNGPWVTSAKIYFSKTNCAAKHKGDKYQNVSYIRQEMLEKVLKWICAYKGIAKIDDYMCEHQGDLDCSELWDYYVSVITWIDRLFTTYRSEMKYVDWGYLYNKYGKDKYVISDLNDEVEKLMLDEDIENKVGIYRYIFTREEKWLNIRSFSPSDRRTAFERQKGVCAICGKHFDFEEMEADHKIAWSKGGKTEPNNCQMLCRKCNREKGNA